MEPEYIILLYSKFSTQCQKIIDILKYSPVSYIKPICIDNKQIRFKIISSEHKISTVPCVLIVYPDKKIEKFEGPTVSDWLLKQMTSTMEDTKTPTSLHHSSSSNTSLNNSLNNTHNVNNNIHNNNSLNNPLNNTSLKEEESFTTLVDDLIDPDEVNAEPYVEPYNPSSQKKSVAEMAAEMQKSREEHLQPPYKPTR